MKHRLFFAIFPPSAIQQEILAWQKELDKLHLPVVWQEADHLHLTLNFLGNKVDSSELTAVRRVGFNAAARTPQFAMKLVFLETLYQRHEETLIYLAPQKPLELLQLQDELSRGLNEIKLPQPRRFLPHMVIGKLKRTDPVTTKDCINKISQVGFTPLTPFMVDKINLYESYVSAKGSHYTKIGEFMLE